MPSLLHILTVADSLRFIAPSVRRAVARGFDVTVVTSPDAGLRRFGLEHGVRTVGVNMPRRLTPLADWKALTQLRTLVERVRPDVVHAHTPKGGLLGSLAAKSCGVPVRLYHMRGLPFVTQRGALRALMQTTERVACLAATKVVCHSPSLREVALAERLLSAEKAMVVLEGGNGVDAAGRFDPTRHSSRRSGAREAWRISADAVVIGFVGRIVRDKGIGELLEAFDSLWRTDANTVLLVAGPLEERDPIDGRAHEQLLSHPGVRYIGHISDTPLVYAASDLVTLPSHREGFPNVPLEAAAMALPVVSTRTPGCTDAVVDGLTGTLVEVGDARALAGALSRYVRDPALRRAHGEAGRARVERSFRHDLVADAMVDFYQAELARAHAGRV